MRIREEGERGSNRRQPGELVPLVRRKEISRLLHQHNIIQPRKMVEFRRVITPRTYPPIPYHGTAQDWQFAALGTHKLHQGNNRTL